MPYLTVINISVECSFTHSEHLFETYVNHHSIVSSKFLLAVQYIFCNIRVNLNMKYSSAKPLGQELSVV